MRVVGSVEIDRPTSDVWRTWPTTATTPAGTRPLPSCAHRCPAQVGVTTHERLRLLGITFRTVVARVARPLIVCILMCRRHTAASPPGDALEQVGPSLPPRLPDPEDM